MNRNREYEDLMAALADPPDELEFAVEKAMKREKASHRKWRIFGIPVGSLAACFAGFVLLVNLFPPFAAACGNIPLLKELAEAVRWSPSLSAAVENEYVQEVGQSQTANGITATAEYVIVDRKQVNIFYTLNSDTIEDLEADYEIERNRETQGFTSSTSSFGLENGELRKISVDFVDGEVPGCLNLSLDVYENSEKWDTEETVTPEEEFDSRFETPVHDPEYLASFEFVLEFNPYYTAQGEVIPVNQTFYLDGQRFVLTEVELYPTHLRVNLEDDENNTAWLKSLNLYLENEHGERFESSVNGISATGDTDGEGYATFWLDSPFFSQGEELTLYITRSNWLDKDYLPIQLDLIQETAENLPEWAEFLKAEKYPEGWMVYFGLPRESDGAMYSLFGSSFTDEEGTEYDIMQFGSSVGVRDPETGERRDEDTMFTEEFPLAGYHGTVAYLEPHFNRVTSFDSPVSLKIK